MHCILKLSVSKLSSLTPDDENYPLSETFHVKKFNTIAQNNSEVYFIQHIMTCGPFLSNG
jgi:hypothetical protein